MQWTIDKNGNQYVTRGGKYYEKSRAEASINSSNSVSSTTAQNYIGYRAILYIK